MHQAQQTSIQFDTTSQPRQSLEPGAFGSPSQFVSPIPQKREREVDTSAQVIRETLATPQQPVRAAPPKHNYKAVTVVSQKKKSPKKKARYEQQPSPKKKIVTRRPVSPTKRLMQMKNATAKNQQKTKGQTDGKILYNVTPGQAYLVQKEDFGKMSEEQF